MEQLIFVNWYETNSKQRLQIYKLANNIYQSNQLHNLRMLVSGQYKAVIKSNKLISIATQL